MKKELLSIKTIILIGVLSGFFFASFMAIFDYLDGDVFSFLQFAFYFLFFGLSMAILFRYKTTIKGED